ncbi:hypothetical protein PBI_MIMI_205 [Arthrobacter phage Mimi]|nr:hypothetical protein PBI_MIMI_285 [Arthrobacter phage Mimi]
MGYRKDAAKGLGEGTLWVIGIGLLLAIIGGVFFTLNVLLAPAKGAGGVVIKNNSAENRIEKQEKFEDLHAKVVFNEDLVAQYKKTVETDPTNNTAKINLEGAKSACKASVRNFNAESRKVTSADWKAIDLPQELTTTRCE